jgi:hypothetical protein
MLTLAMCAALLFAQEAPLTGTWKINSTQSVVDAPLPTLFHDGVITFRAPNGPHPYAKGAPIRIIDNSGKDKRIFEINITSDGRTASMKELDNGSDRIPNQHHLVLYLERQ